MPLFNFSTVENEAIGANESINFLLFLLKVHEGLDSKYSFKKKNPVIIAITRFY